MIIGIMLNFKIIPRIKIKIPDVITITDMRTIFFILVNIELEHEKL